VGNEKKPLRHDGISERFPDGRFSESLRQTTLPGHGYIHVLKNDENQWVIRYRASKGRNNPKQNNRGNSVFYSSFKRQKKRHRCTPGKKAAPNRTDYSFLFR
jgi:hypothetical protein